MTTRAATPIERSAALDFFHNGYFSGCLRTFLLFFVISTIQAAIGQASHLLA